MTHKRVTQLLALATTLLAIVLPLCGLAANHLLSAKSAELSKLKAESQVTDELYASLKKSRVEIQKYADLNAIAKTVVPQDKDQAQTVNEIVRIARDSGIPNLSSITFPASTLGTTGTGTSRTSLTQLTPVKGIAGVYLLPITVVLDANRAVPYDQFITFLKRLENNRRTSLVSDITISPDQKNASQVSFTLVINEYIKP